MKRSTAEIVREYGPFPDADQVNGVTYDGENVWFGAGDKIVAFDPASGQTRRSIDAADPSWPSQALEGLWALLGIPVVLALERLVGRTGRSGRGIVLLVALAWWLTGRAVVALTWKDDRLLGPFGPEATSLRCSKSFSLCFWPFETLYRTH